MPRVNSWKSQESGPHGPAPILGRRCDEGKLNITVNVRRRAAKSVKRGVVHSRETDAESAGSIGDSPAKVYMGPRFSKNERASGSAFWIAFQPTPQGTRDTKSMIPKAASIDIEDQKMKHTYLVAVLVFSCLSIGIAQQRRVPQLLQALRPVQPTVLSVLGPRPQGQRLVLPTVSWSVPERRPEGLRSVQLIEVGWLAESRILNSANVR
jgi:hypothetical protein